MSAHDTHTSKKEQELLQIAYYKMLKASKPEESFWIFAKVNAIGEPSIQTYVHENDEVAKITSVTCDILKRRLQKKGYLNLD